MRIQVFLWGGVILFRNLYVYRNPDYKVDDHPAHWNKLKEFEKKTSMTACCTSMLVLHPCMALQAQRCPLQRLTSCATQSWTHLSPVGMAPSLSRTWPGTEALPNQTVKGFHYYAINKSACYLCLDLKEFRLRETGLESCLWLLTTAKQSTSITFAIQFPFCMTPFLAVVHSLRCQLEAM